MSTHNEELFNEAKQYIPGGVNSPVRAFKSVGGTPVFIERAAGPYVYGADGKRYIDYVGSWGPMVVGHAHPDVLNAVRAAVGRGLSFGAPTVAETTMAKALWELVPSLSLVRLVNSGTEATMSAIRLARGYSNREKIVKFEGCYHGHSDGLLVEAGSGGLTFGVPSSPGVPDAVAGLTLTAQYNDLESVRDIFQQHEREIACVIVEPVAGNMSCVPPVPGFLEGLREICDAHGAMLIFDEVMSGFRVALGGAQGLYGVRPDLTALGKVVGGGLPAAAFGGRQDLMEQLAPLGPIYQAGTLSGNPVAMAAGLETLRLVAEPGFFERLTERTTHLVEGIKARAENAGISLVANTVGGMFGLFFTDQPVVSNLTQVKACDSGRFKRFFHGMLGEGVYFAPSPFEAGFVSAAHDSVVIGETLLAVERVFKRL